MSMRIAVVGRGDHRLERVGPGQQPDVRHPNHREPVEAVGADRAAGRSRPASAAESRPAQTPDPDAVAHDVDRVRRRALVVEAEAARVRRAASRRR